MCPTDKHRPRNVDACSNRLRLWDAITVVSITQCGNRYKKLQFIHNVNGDGSKTAKKSLKGDITHDHMAWKSTWSPFNDFCGFWSVAVNIMDKLQFLIFIFAVLLPNLCNVLLCNYRTYLSSLGLSILSTAAVRHTRLSKIKTLTLRQVLGANYMHHRAKFHPKTVEHLQRCCN